MHKHNMGMFDRFRKMLNLGARKKVFTASDGHRYVGGSGFGSTFSFFKGLSYDNTYPSISKIANEFMTIRPYAIDANGKPVQNVRLLNKLYHPNQQMSSVDFREALAVMALVHRKVYLLMWREEDGKAHPGGDVTAEDIAGFTFLEGVHELSVEGGKTYKVGGKTYTQDEVIEIYAGIDPYDLSRGYSPSVAAAKWANLDDYIAAYQAGFFENGAVPSGQFIITAKSAEDFNDQVDKMEAKHRGSGRNNNIVYTHRPISPTTGNPSAAQIEWVPFNQTNKDMSLDAIFKQANDKIDSAYGVPESIRGVNDNNTYASVRVDEQIFIKYAVYPFALKIWTRFTHEMNRVTGGLGFAITFDLDIPGVVDEEKVEAEKKLIELNIIDKAITMGYELGSVVDAFQLNKGYKLLEGGNTPIKNDKPEVDEGDEVEVSPNSTGSQDGKAAPLRKTEFGDTHEHHHCSHSHKAAEPDDPDVVEDIAKVVREFMQKQINGAIDGNELSSKDVNDADEKDITEIVTLILAITTAYMLVRGGMTYQEGIKLLVDNDIKIDNTSEYIVSEVSKSSYRAYLTNVARSYSTDTANHIRDILAQGMVEGWDKEAIATRLRGIMDTDEWRVQRLARTEEHRSVANSSVDAMQQLMNETGATIVKTWHVNSSDPCEFCLALDGKSEVVTQSFLPVGGTVNGVDGGTFMNDFVNVDGANLHPNCHCYTTYEVEKS